MKVSLLDLGIEISSYPPKEQRQRFSLCNMRSQVILPIPHLWQLGLPLTLQLTYREDERRVTG